MTRILIFLIITSIASAQASCIDLGDGKECNDVIVIEAKPLPSPKEVKKSKPQSQTQDVKKKKLKK